MKKIITASILAIVTMVSANPTMANGKQWHNCNMNYNLHQITCDEGYINAEVDTHTISGSIDDVSQGLYSFTNSTWYSWDDEEVYRESVLSISRDTSNWFKDDYRGVYRYRFNGHGAIYQSRYANKQLHSVTSYHHSDLFCWVGDDSCYIKNVK